MKSKLIAPLLLASAGALSLTAQASMSFTSASAFIDWTSFNVQIFDTNMTDGITAAITWSNQSSYVRAWDGIDTNLTSGGWTTPINIENGVASGLANSDRLVSTFASPPSGLDAYAAASRKGDFSVTANTVLLFTANADTSIDLPIPLNGSAYAWATLDAVGTNGDTQHGTASKISWAGAFNKPEDASGLMSVYFVNVSGASITGNLTAGTSISSHGFIPAVPEPETYAMLLAGLGLMGFIARRRMK